MISEALGGMWQATHEDPPYEPLEDFVSKAVIEGDFERVSFAAEDLELEFEGGEVSG